ncbi:hypothetical protein EVAR_28559_1 [Eumeta japonica]|uniref:Uncharacterized protein n=1 Tax=Eumeta variegata TaxID=151549 RepID=A0A4C1UXB1_EUMVA|nr:hypothetical protein EVAR_28559_1 [Eumeta japonica]
MLSCRIHFLRAVDKSASPLSDAGEEGDLPKPRTRGAKLGALGQKGLLRAYIVEKVLEMHTYSAYGSKPRARIDSEGRQCTPDQDKANESIESNCAESIIVDYERRVYRYVLRTAVVPSLLGESIDRLKCPHRSW